METDKKHYPNIAQSWGILGAIILCSLVFSPISLIKMNRAPDLPQLLCYLLTMGVPFLIFSYVRKSKTGESPYRFEKAPGKIFLLIILGTVTIQAGITLPLSNLIPMPEWVVRLFLESMNVQGVFSFITIALAAPILEELIFRGIILDGFLKRYSSRKAIIMSSVLFGIVHLNPWQFVSAALLGMFIGWIYSKTHNLLLAILIHFVNNSIAAVMMLVSDTYQSMDINAIMNETLVDTYGGTLNAILIISGSICIACLSVYLLTKEFNKNKNIILPAEQSE